VAGTSNPFRPEEDSTSLVDRLIQYTQRLMQGSNRHIVAFSGGVDSSLVLALLKQAALSQKDSVEPVLGISPAVPSEQVDLARQVSSALGYDLTIVRTDEGSDETYIANEGKACLACKSHLYQMLSLVLKHRQNDSNYGSLYNGTNADDKLDPTRLGLIAAQDFQVKSPLQNVTKSEVRIAARHLGLPNWNYAASPCLRSRLALGVHATEQHLRTIEAAERFVKQQLGELCEETTNLRVRMLAKGRARIEIDTYLVGVVQQRLDEWTPKFQDEWGFSSLHAKEFRSGSVATTNCEQRIQAA
jgi:uncharacterized protein (TIGR00268 family)